MGRIKKERKRKMRVKKTELKKVEQMLALFEESNGIVARKRADSTNCSACFNSCYGTCGYNCIAVCRNSYK